MTDCLFDNPYEKLYLSTKLVGNKMTDICEVQSILRHLGYMYNTFGKVVKDLIKVVAIKFQQSQAQQSRQQPSKYTEPNIPNNNASKTSVIEKTYSKQLGQKGSQIRQQKYKKKSKKRISPKKQLIIAEVDDDFQFQNEIKHFPHNPEGKLNHPTKSSNNLIRKSQKTMNFQIPFTQFQIPKEQQLKSPSRSNIFSQYQQQIQNPKRISSNKNKQINQTIIIQQQQINKKCQDMDVIYSEKVRHHSDHTNNDFDIFSDNSKCLRIYPGRKKKDRQHFQGISCQECEKYYKFMDCGGENLCSNTSRHKSNIPMRKINDSNFTQQFDDKMI